MLAVVGVAWTVFAIVTFTLSLFSIGFTKYYQSKRESELSATLVTMVSLTLIFAMVALLPIDVFLVSSTVDSQTGLKKLWADSDTIYWLMLTVQIMYYVFYGSIVTFSFFVIPFTYVYYEKEQGQQSKHEKRKSALKYTLFFVSIILLLFLFGLFLKPTILPPHIDLEWFKNLLTESNGAKAIWFVVGCLFIPGMAVFIVYTAPGLSILPFYLIKGKSKIDLENEDIHHKLDIVRERQRLIKQKYSGSNNNEALDTHDYRTLENLDDEERILVRRLNGIEQDKTNVLQRILKFSRPFQIAIGLILSTFTILMTASIFITIIDKITFSVCGRKCGYIITQTQLFNPVNFIFTRLLFPLDYLFMIFIIIYFFLATMMGIIQIEVKFLWVKLYRIKKGFTTPQGLLFSTILLTFGLLAFNYSITSVVAPGYAHFGSQVYCNHTEGGRRDCTFNMDQIVSCDIYAPTEICTPTVSSVLIDRITLNTPMLGVIFYYSEWLFLLSFVFGFIILLLKTSSNNDEESQGLLSSQGLLDHHHS